MNVGMSNSKVSAIFFEPFLKRTAHYYNVLNTLSGFIINAFHPFIYLIFNQYSPFTDELRIKHTLDASVCADRYSDR